VLCAGIPRSGSTWLYNAARLLLTKARGQSGVHGAWIEQYDAGNPAAWHVVKVHEPRTGEPLLWRAKVALTSRRDLRDIVASAWKRGWISDDTSAMAFADDVVRQHAFWAPRCAYEMVYERMREEPRDELRRIASALDVQIPDSTVAQVSGEIDALGFDDADTRDFHPDTLLHKRHVLDGRVGYHAETLPVAVVANINERHAAWLTAHGYAGAPTP
jgi:hypothetical protein